MQQELAHAGVQVLTLGVVEMPQQDLVRQGQRPAQSAPDTLEVTLHRRVDRGRPARVDSIFTMLLLLQRVRQPVAAFRRGRGDYSVRLRAKQADRDALRAADISFTGVGRPPAAPAPEEGGAG